jgi:VWFA-related protein
MRRRTPVTCLCTLALVSTSVVLLVGQRQPSYRSGVEVIVIDVNVVDTSHVPVGDLTAKDFIVSVDHKPRRVASSQFLRYAMRTATTTDRDTVPAPGRATPINVPAVPSPARNVLIVIDEDSMEPGDGLLVQREAAKFIDRLAPDDRIGVVTIPRMQSEVTMTKIREDAKAALAKVITGSERYRSQMFRIGLWEAFAAEGDSSVLSGIQARACRLQDAVCRQEVAQEVRVLQRQEHWRGDRLLRALRDLGLALEKVNGPKTMLLVSGGTPPPDLKSNTSYSLIGDAFAAAQVSLYTLYVEQSEFGQVKYRASPTPAQDRLVEREGIENATSAAGGTFMESVGTWDQYFDRIVTELSGSYLLGIEVEPTDRNGRPHQVSVKVTRRGVDVRARTRYVIPPDNVRRNDPADIAAAMPAPTPPTPVPSKVAATPPPAQAAARAAEAASELQLVLSRLVDYVAGYRREYSAVVAEEDYRQSTPTERVHLRSDFLLIKSPDAEGWVSFRDVYEVDGVPVRDREDRLKKLFLDPTPEARSQLNQIKEESARYNIGEPTRNVNVPLFPLLFLDPVNVPRFQFKLGGQRESQGVRVRQIEYKEQERPTIVKNVLDDRDMPASGWFLIDAVSGAVVQTAVFHGDSNESCEIIVQYKRDPVLGMWVPAEMNETYRGRSGTILGTASYSKFRRFTVTTEEKITIPK